MNRTLPAPWKPTKTQLLAAQNKLVPDLIAKNLIVLFAGINPGLYTAAIGRHFGRPGNRFWPALYGGGFTPRLFSPFENSLLLDLKFGITNIVERAGGPMNSPTRNFARAASALRPRSGVGSRRSSPSSGSGHTASSRGLKTLASVCKRRPLAAAMRGSCPTPAGSTRTICPLPWQNSLEICAFGRLRSMGAAERSASFLGYDQEGLC